MEDASGNRTEINTCYAPIVGDFSKTRHWVKPLSGVKMSLVFFKLDISGSKKGRVKQAQPTAEEVMSYVDPSHMFNPMPGVSRIKNGRSYVSVVVPSPPWAKLNNPALIK